MIDYSKEENAVAITAIFKMKMQQTVERIKEVYLQDTCGAKMFFENYAYEEDE